jgi:hypothetical protein
MIPTLNTLAYFSDKVSFLPRQLGTLILLPVPPTKLELWIYTTIPGLFFE